MITAEISRCYPATAVTYFVRNVARAPESHKTEFSRATRISVSFLPPKKKKKKFFGSSPTLYSLSSHRRYRARAMSFVRGEARGKLGNACVIYNPVVRRQGRRDEQIDRRTESKRLIGSPTGVATFDASSACADQRRISCVRRLTYISSVIPRCSTSEARKV